METKAPNTNDLQVTHGTRDSSKELRLLLLFSGSTEAGDRWVKGGDSFPSSFCLLRNGIFILTWKGKLVERKEDQRHVSGTGLAQVHEIMGNTGYATTKPDVLKLQPKANGPGS